MAQLKLVWHLPARRSGAYPYPIWPEGWPLPRIGEIIFVAPGQPPLWVHGIDYFPSGEEFGDSPFIHIVLSETAR